MFPPHIARVLEDFGVPADTKAALYDLYVSMGDEVLEVFSDIAEAVASPTHLRPEDTVEIRHRLVERYLRRNHPRWLAGSPTASLWHPRVLEGRASGLAVPLGEVPDSAYGVVGENQIVPDGILILGRNAHYGGRQETISFDIVARELDDAIAIGQAAGQQHTMPGSIGETSGTFDSVRQIALIWEIQPNVYKPAGDRNRSIARLHRKHRNWHLATLACALDWLRAREGRIYILRGEALAPTHEVNPARPVSEMIVAHHNRTVERVVAALGGSLDPLTPADEALMSESPAMNHALRKHVAEHGAAAAMWRVMLPTVQ